MKITDKMRRLPRPRMPSRKEIEAAAIAWTQAWWGDSFPFGMHAKRSQKELREAAKKGLEAAERVRRSRARRKG